MKIYATCPNCGASDFKRTGDGFTCMSCNEYTEIEELSLVSESEANKREFLVEIPTGKLRVAAKGAMFDYPGIYIEFIGKDEKNSCSDRGNLLACVEYDNQDKDILTTAYDNRCDEPVFYHHHNVGIDSLTVAASVGAKQHNTKSISNVILNRIRCEGMDVDVYNDQFYIVEKKSMVDENYVNKLIYQTTQEYMATIDGQREWEECCHDFNYGDWAHSIPTDILESHGIFFRLPDELLGMPIGATISVTVNQDAILGCNPWDLPDDLRHAFYTHLAKAVAERADHSSVLDQRMDDLIGKLTQTLEVNNESVTILDDEKRCRCRRLFKQQVDHIVQDN